MQILTEKKKMKDEGTVEIANHHQSPPQNIKADLGAKSSVLMQMFCTELN